MFAVFFSDKKKRKEKEKKKHLLSTKSITTLAFQ